MELIPVLDRVPGLMSHDAHALGARCPFHIEDLIALEAAQAWVREVERDGEPGDPAGREPLVGEPDVRLEHELSRVELLVQLRDTRSEPRSLDGNAEVLEPDLEQSVIAVALPGETLHVEGKRETGTGNREQTATARRLHAAWRCHKLRASRDLVGVANLGRAY